MTKAAKPFGINITPHIFRHTFVSRCNEYEVNRTMSKKWTGHKTDKMHDRYTHKTMKLEQDAIGRLFESSKSTPKSTPIRSEIVESGVENDVEKS